MEESFTMPPSIMNQLNEFSYGGFLLFCFGTYNKAFGI